MLRLPLVALCFSSAFAADLYQIDGRFTPQEQARVLLHGVRTPLTRETRTSSPGRFRFKKVPAGSYTLVVIIQSYGEARRSIEVGPATAGKARSVTVVQDFKPSDFELEDYQRRRHSASVGDLQIPDKAKSEYLQAQKDLIKPDVDAAVKHLERAVALAPQFSAAWNNLGTIAYQRRESERAAECFRKALEADPESFEALVNLGGALLALRDYDGALDCNVHAVATRPDDALAQSQLGLSYFAVGNFDLAVKHLEAARRIDPGHFSMPQVTLAEIHLRRGENRAAADVLEELLKYHPDYEAAKKVRAAIEQLRK